MKGIELEVMLVIEPRAFEIVELNRFLKAGIGPVIKDVDCPDSDLEYVNVAAKRGDVVKGNLEFQF